MTAAPLTDRNLPAPWVACEVCSSTVPALPDLDGSPRCPQCAQTERLTTAAYDHLALFSPPRWGPGATTTRPRA